MLGHAYKPQKKTDAALPLEWDADAAERPVTRLVPCPEFYVVPDGF